MTHKLLMQLNNVLPITKALPAFTQLSSLVIPKPMQTIMLQLVFNRLFSKEITEGQLHFLFAKKLALVVTDLNMAPLLFSMKNNKISVEFSDRELADILLDDHANVCISGKLNSFILLASQQVDPDTLFFKRELTITGNTDLGLHIKNFLDTIELEALPSIFEQMLVLYHQELQVVS